MERQASLIKWLNRRSSMVSDFILLARTYTAEIGLTDRSTVWQTFLSKFLYLGYSLEETIAAVTSHAAAWLCKPELGRIQVGDVANLTLFNIRNEPTRLIDSEGERRVASELIEAKGVVVGGEYIKC